MKCFKSVIAAATLGAPIGNVGHSWRGGLRTIMNRNKPSIELFRSRGCASNGQEKFSDGEAKIVTR
jgi:hypothetical protein